MKVSENKFCSSEYIQMLKLLQIVQCNTCESRTLEMMVFIPPQYDATCTLLTARKKIIRS